MQTQSRIWKDTYHLGCVPDFPKEPFDIIRRAQPAPVSHWKGKDRQLFWDVRSHPLRQPGIRLLVFLHYRGRVGIGDGTVRLLPVLTGKARKNDVDIFVYSASKMFC